MYHSFIHEDQYGTFERMAVKAFKKFLFKMLFKRFIASCSRFRKNFSQLLEEDAVQNPDPPNYLSAQAPPSRLPARRFCAVCGFPACQSCPTCGAR
jgi:hypothetical protein